MPWSPSSVRTFTNTRFRCASRTRNVRISVIFIEPPRLLPGRSKESAPLPAWMVCKKGEVEMVATISTSPFLPGTLSSSDGGGEGDVAEGLRENDRHNPLQFDAGPGMVGDL